MKIRLTFIYVLSIATVAIIVVIINILTIVFLSQNINLQNKNDRKVDISDFVREYEIYLESENDNIYVTDAGKQLIDDKEAWIQILNEDNKEVYSYNKPEIIKNKYTSIEIINGYKYAGGLGDTSQILAGDKIFNNITYTYLIGFPKKNLQKFVLIAETSTMIESIKYSLISIVIVDFFIAVIVGYIFSKGLLRPVKTSIDYIDDLYLGKYEVYMEEKGIYSNVFKRLNNLAYKLKQNEIERKKLDKMRDEWIANISHDIKTPLSSIKGYAEFLSEDYNFSNKEIKDYAEIINNKADYIKELVDDLNLNMKLKSNKLILNKEEVNIVTLVKNCIIDILNDSNYNKSNIEFNCENIRIVKNIDKILIQRVINNLMYNALIHNNEDVKIIVTIFTDEKLYIIIEDDGIGISEEDLNNIFERYYRGTNTGEAHKGSGLGMSIVKEIINAHNGEIKISSTLGKGTKIEITL